MKAVILSIYLTISYAGIAQNLVPNPSFEDNNNCIGGMPHMNCATDWKDYVTAGMNSADICFNGAVFFPPSSIPAYDGNNYLGVDCQAWDFAEFGQVKLTGPMQAGVTYCVSFYASMCDQNVVIPPSIGVRFSDNEVTGNPFVMGLQADVQGAVPFDPNNWTQITGTYTATGGEEFLQVGGFENNAQGNFTYMYVDLIEVYALTTIDLPETHEICIGDSYTINAAPNATAYLWNTGETSQSIDITSAGIYWVEETRGACTLRDSITVTEIDCNTTSPNVVNTFNVELPSGETEAVLVEESESEEELETTLFVPNAFTPDGDSRNNTFKAVGENIDQFQISIYNKWGELVFNGSDISQGWDGNDATGPAQSDVYIYQIRYEDQFGPKEKFGHVLLLR